MLKVCQIDLTRFIWVVNLWKSNFGACDGWRAVFQNSPPAPHDVLEKQQAKSFIPAVILFYGSSSFAQTIYHVFKVSENKEMIGTRDSGKVKEKRSDPYDRSFVVGTTCPKHDHFLYLCLAWTNANRLKLVQAGSNWWILSRAGHNWLASDENLI